MSGRSEAETQGGLTQTTLATGGARRRGREPGAEPKGARRGVGGIQAGQIVERGLGGSQSDEKAGK